MKTRQNIDILIFNQTETKTKKTDNFIPFEIETNRREYTDMVISDQTERKNG